MATSRPRCQPRRHLGSLARHLRPHLPPAQQRGRHVAAVESVPHPLPPISRQLPLRGRQVRVQVPPQIPCSPQPPPRARPESAPVHHGREGAPVVATRRRRLHLSRSLQRLDHQRASAQYPPTAGHLQPVTRSAATPPAHHPSTPIQAGAARSRWTDAHYHGFRFDRQGAVTRTSTRSRWLRAMEETTTLAQRPTRGVAMATPDAGLAPHPLPRYPDVMQVLRPPSMSPPPVPPSMARW